MFRYIFSFIKPVELTAPYKMIVIIRGLRFEAATRSEVLAQIQNTTDSYAEGYPQDMENVSYGLSGAIYTANGIFI